MCSDLSASLALIEMMERGEKRASDAATAAELSRRFAAVKRLMERTSPVFGADSAIGHKTHDFEPSFINQQRVALDLLCSDWLQ